MPEETPHEKQFAAIVAANYHAAKATKRYGGDWADRVKWLEASQSSVLTRIPKLDDAMKLLGRREDRPTERQTLWTHARAAVTRAHALTHGPRDRRIRDALITKGADPENPNLLEIVGVLEELALKNARFTVDRLSYDPVSGLSEFGATLRHQRRDIDTLDNWKFSADPRHWKDVLPEMFELSEEIDDPLVPDRFIDPPFTREEDLTTPPDSFHLFEIARLKMIGLPLTKFRNVLDVNFVTSRKGAVETLAPTYSLHESLTNTVLDFPRREGGIDVDSCTPGESQVKLAPKTVTVKAAKRIRFSAETDFAIEMNLLALPFLEAWITELLIGGAAAGGAAAQRPLQPPKRPSIRIAAE